MRFEVSLDGSAVIAAAPHVEPPSPPAPCSDLDCFTQLVRARADEHRTVVLAMTNAGFAPFWHNLRCSLERQNVSQHAIIIGTDAAACEAAASVTVPCVVGGEGLLWDDASAGSSRTGDLSQRVERHGTAAYARLMHIKARPALEALRLGYHLIFTDTDVVWLRNPLCELRRGALGRALAAGELDVLIQSDYDESNEAQCSSHEQCGRSSWCDVAAGRCEAEACGGFYLLRAGQPAIAMLESLFARMAWQRLHVDERLGEQPALNYVLRRTPGMRYRILPREEYPNGNSYFLRRVWPAARTASGQPRAKSIIPTIVHNSAKSGSLTRPAKP